MWQDRYRLPNRYKGGSVPHKHMVYNPNRHKMVDVPSRYTWNGSDRYCKPDNNLDMDCELNNGSDRYCKPDNKLDMYCEPDNKSGRCCEPDNEFGRYQFPQEYRIERVDIFGKNGKCRLKVPLPQQFLIT